MKTTVYVVKSGDTLSSVAKRFNTDVASIAGFNGITDPDKLDEGQILRIPQQEAREEYLTYTVQKGDVIAQPAEGKLGACIHASISGTVKAIADGCISIEK